MNSCEPQKQTNASQTLVRGLEIIDTILDGRRTITEIASHCGLTYSTAHRLISVLLQRGYLRHAADGELGPGTKLVQIGFAARRSFDVVSIAQPHLRKLARETADTVHLATRRGANVLYLDKIESQRPVEIRSWIGGERPAIATGVGMASLVDMPDDQLRELFQRENGKELTGMNVKAWLKQMACYISEQVAFDLGESEPAIRCVAAPIRDVTSTIVAAISVTSTVNYMPVERMQKLLIVVRTYALAISRDLGYEETKGPLGKE